jgi:hypothetical protein
VIGVEVRQEDLGGALDGELERGEVGECPGSQVEEEEILLRVADLDDQGA